MRQAMVNWALKVISRRRPDFEVGEPGDVYLRRWWILPRNKVFNIYLHHFLKSDDDRALHDHPWWNVSWILAGGYFEWREDLASGWRAREWRSAGSLTLRNATTPHRIELLNDPTVDSLVLTLFFTGPVVRNWGFHCPQGWRRWQDFVSVRPGGNAKGRGCE